MFFDLINLLLTYILVRRFSFVFLLLLLHDGKSRNLCRIQPRTGMPKFPMKNSFQCSKPDLEPVTYIKRTWFFYNNYLLFVLIGVHLG